MPKVDIHRRRAFVFVEPSLAMVFQIVSLQWFLMLVKPAEQPSEASACAALLLLGEWLFQIEWIDYWQLKRSATRFISELFVAAWNSTSHWAKRISDNAVEMKVKCKHYSRHDFYLKIGSTNSQRSHNMIWLNHPLLSTLTVPEQSTKMLEMKSSRMAVPWSQGEGAEYLLPPVNLSFFLRLCFSFIW